MKYLFTALLVSLLGAVPGVAQELRKAELQHAPQPDQPYVLHVSDWLARQPAARQAVAEYQRLKAAGALPAPAKTGQEPQVGDRETFRVSNFKTNEREDIVFELRVIEERFYIWVEVDNNTVTEAHVTELTRLLADETPADSYDPNMGIIELDEVIFGTPPNVDGDGKTDVLFLDIRDNYDPAQENHAFIAGFVDPADMSGAQGNHRDILYLDTFPALTQQGGGFDTIGATAIHEYQHLIHLAYDLNELSLINEGLSEWSEVAAGFAGRTISYLANPDTYNIRLLRWSGNQNSGVLDDYQRGGLFTTYLAERLGVLEVGKVARTPANGMEGIREVIEETGTGLTLEALIADFHTANIINDTAVEPRFGYSYSQRVGLKATPGLVVDGRTATETAEAVISVAQGAVQYAVWNDVTDFELVLRTTTGADDDSAVLPRVVLEQDGQITVQDVALGPDVQTFSGVYDRITLVLPSSNALGVFENIIYGATWTNEETFTAETIIYDDGVVPREGNQLDAYSLGSGSRQANRFEVPRGGILSAVSVAPYYDNQFSGSSLPPGAPRNFRLHIWEENGAGVPGTEVFAQEFEDPRFNSGETLSFFEVDLGDFRDVLSGLVGTIYIGLTNAGSDQNYIVMGVTRYEGENVDASFLYLPSFNNGQGGWASFSSIQVGGEPALAERVLPIRATFLVSSQPVANEDAPELPGQLVLDQNYPNPFNPRTSIRYVLPQAGEVTLTVFDVLGREVATLFDGTQPAGAHTVELDAGAWASGMYFYTLEANDQLQTRRMVLLK